jgi:hypothetical protein
LPNKRAVEMIRTKNRATIIDYHSATEHVFRQP